MAKDAAKTEVTPLTQLEERVETAISAVEAIPVPDIQLTKDQAYRIRLELNKAVQKVFDRIAPAETRTTFKFGK